MGGLSGCCQLEALVFGDVLEHIHIIEFPFLLVAGLGPDLAIWIG